MAWKKSREVRRARSQKNLMRMLRIVVRNGKIISRVMA